MKNIFIKNAAVYICLITVVLVTSCSREKFTTSNYTFSGHLYKDCSMEAIKNRGIELYQIDYSGFNPTINKISVTTDATGYFEFKFTPIGPGPVKLQSLSGSYIYYTINPPLSNRNLTNLVIYEHPTANIQVSFNVLKPYTNKDTLQIANRATGRDTFIAGPFKSGVLFTVLNYGVTMTYPATIVDCSFSINIRKTGLSYDSTIKIYKYCTDTNKAVITIQ